MHHPARSRTPFTLGKLFVTLFVTAMALAGCESRVDEPQEGLYRATLKLPGGEAPFGFEIAKEAKDGKPAFVIYLTNATERTRVDNVQLANGELTATFLGYENTLHAKLFRDRLEGNVTLIKADSKEQVIPFAAKRGENYRFYKDALTDNADVAGTWEVALNSDDGETTRAVAIFQQEHDRVTGTVMTPTGDHRFLDGQVRGEEVQLSTFAGGLAYLYKLKVNKRGELEGDVWQGLTSHSKVNAVRNEDAALDTSSLHTELKKDVQRFDFTFRDVDGKQVSLSDPQFHGKVVVVTLGGSWCPNCHDEAMFLVPFYKEYRAKGVEIIALMFERHGEFDRAAKAVRGYRKDLGIEFTTLIAGVSDTDEASKALPTLTGVYGYPTTLMVDKAGTVRDVHVGFTGPATGRHYDEYVAEFHTLVNELLAEPAPAN